MRERLVDLINEAKDEYPTIPTVNCCKPTFAYYLADRLLANGAIVPPYKVGDTVYSCVGNAYRLEKIVIESCSKNATLVLKSGLNGQLIFDENDIGKTVFLTREEAEQALKGGR